MIYFSVILHWFISVKLNVYRQKKKKKNKQPLNFIWHISNWMKYSTSCAYTHLTLMSDRSKGWRGRKSILSSTWWMAVSIFPYLRFLTLCLDTHLQQECRGCHPNKTFSPCLIYTGYWGEFYDCSHSCDLESRKEYYTMICVWQPWRSYFSSG